MTVSDSEERVEELEDSMNYLRRMTRLSADIVAAQSGDSAALERVRERGTVEGRFPGNRQRAMGFALKYVEDMAELGIEAEREYISEEDSSHRIDIHIGSEET